MLTQQFLFCFVSEPLLCRLTLNICVLFRTQQDAYRETYKHNQDVPRKNALRTAFRK
jgi:hypothetical protein